MASNLTTDNLKKASSLNSTEYNSTLNVITADGDTLKRLPISEVVKNRIEKLSYPEKPAIVDSGDTWLEEKEIGKGIARQKALQNNAQINFDKDIYFFNNKVFCLTSIGYAIIDVSTNSTSGDIYVTGNYKHIVSDNIFIWFIADTVEESKCFRIETMEELTTELDTLGETKCLFYLDSYYDSASSKTYKAICVNKLDDLTEYMRRNLAEIGTDLEIENATNIIYVNMYMIEKTPFQYYIKPSVVCDTFIFGELAIVNTTEEMTVSTQYFFYSQKQNRIVVVDISTDAPVVTKDVTLSKTFAGDIGEVYIEQANTDKIYLAGKSYDTSIKVQTVNGEKTIPTLDGMNELEQRVENVEKKVSSSENEMSLIETEINKVNANIEAVNANVESVGEQVAQWVLIGEVKQYFGATIPDKYLLCNGQEIAQANYPELYAVIGSLECCQSENEGMFKVPDLQNRFLQGANGNLGTVKEAGLPNIVGDLEAQGTNAKSVGSNSSSSPLFKVARVGTVDSGTSQTSNYQNIVTFDASQVNSIYGKSNTVQPPAISVNYIIRAKI